MTCWSIKLLSKRFNYKLYKSTEGVILYIIIGDAHQFIGHCLIPFLLQLCEELDADNVTKTFKVSKQTDVDSTKFQGKPKFFLHLHNFLQLKSLWVGILYFESGSTTPHHLILLPSPLRLIYLYLT